jgi:hypothetical protein
VDQKFSAIASLSQQVNLYARHQQQHIQPQNQSATTTTITSWPFVTLPDYADRARVVHQLSEAVLSTRIIPIVYHNDRAAWERYSVQHFHDWFDPEDVLTGFDIVDQEDAIDVENANNNATNRRVFHSFRAVQNLQMAATEDSGVVDFTTGIANRIFAFNASGDPVPQVDAPFFLPSWQAYPSIDKRQGTANLDAINDMAHARYWMKLIETGDMLLGGLQQAPPGGVDHPDVQRPLEHQCQQMGRIRLRSHEYLVRADL